ncbi:hypothetical protein BJX76DRAFT_330708 [Aspergillus varians]
MLSEWAAPLFALHKASSICCDGTKMTFSWWGRSTWKQGRPRVRSWTLSTPRYEQSTGMARGYMTICAGDSIEIQYARIANGPWWQVDT